MPTTSSNSTALGDRAIDIKEVLRRACVKRTKLYKMIKSGEFAAPKKYGRLSRWSERYLDEWLGKRFNHL